MLDRKKSYTCLWEQLGFISVELSGQLSIGRLKSPRTQVYTVTVIPALQSSASFWVRLDITVSMSLTKINQRTNGPVNAHLISGPSKSTKHTKPGKNKVNKRP